METRTVSIPRGPPLGSFDEGPKGGSALDRLGYWRVSSRPEAEDGVAALRPAAEHLRTRDTPVAFPTETVYGLGADATRSASVRGIYAAKGRPSDNPLIVHVCDLRMLRGLLLPGGAGAGEQDDGAGQDVIPAVYRPLVDRFWPGPLTILLPTSPASPLAPEVTAGLPSFGARMPASGLAQTLIRLAGVPLAAPSANASTRPSPTTAQHVRDDLDGRIELILDGGPCAVGVESTVVDGLCDPPAVLRPGGISVEDLRCCPGWERVVRAYGDRGGESAGAPRAPGMKYKHYSPRARVVLYESTHGGGGAGAGIDVADRCAAVASPSRTTTDGDGPGPGLKRVGVGVIRTRRWPAAGGLPCGNLRRVADGEHDKGEPSPYELYAGGLMDDLGDVVGDVFDIHLGDDTQRIARGLFSALRELDRRGVHVIFVDGIDDDVDIAAAVMNRLRKAASEVRA